ncbi:hypothetical protein AGDE_06042 [Angomonas deanei]|nr:hypothetical protein AGDE_06042 [Angomonas deanei]|eukprot:EPY37891.1 hypothetical protein AGDE_06042 [Angomonas deanei]
MLPANATEDTKWLPTMTLVEGIRNAFQNAADLWGPVQPPTMATVSTQLSGETEKLLQDLVSNPNCLDAYCYQLPIVKQMRDASKESLLEIKRLADENNTLRRNVETTNANVQKMQKELQSQMDYLQKVGNNPLVKSVCTTKDLLVTLENDVKKLNNECDVIGRDCLSAYSKDRREFQQKLAEFKAKAKLAHVIDLKRRSYKQQTQS